MHTRLRRQPRIDLVQMHHRGGEATPCKIKVLCLILLGSKITQLVAVEFQLCTKKVGIDCLVVFQVATKFLSHTHRSMLSYLVHI